MTSLMVHFCSAPLVCFVDALDTAENGAMKSIWGRPTGTGMASTALLLCLALLSVLAACGGE